MPVTGCPMLRVDVGKPRFRNVKLAGAVMVESTTEIVSSAAGRTQSDLARFRFQSVQKRIGQKKTPPKSLSLPVTNDG